MFILTDELKIQSLQTQSLLRWPRCRFNVLHIASRIQGNNPPPVHQSDHYTVEAPEVDRSVRGIMHFGFPYDILPQA